MQEDLLTLSCWAETWCMEFNTKKCYAIHIQTKKQKRENVCIPYIMKGVELQRVSDTAYFGVRECSLSTGWGGSQIIREYTGKIF